MCTSPSMPSSSLTNTPYGTMLTTLPRTRDPTGYFCSIPSQGEGVFCFSPRAIFSFSRSTPMIITSSSWSMRTIWEGCPMRPQLMSVMCSSPSMPPRSTNAPKSAMFLTTPLRSCPTSTSASSFSLASARRSSISRRRETTMLRAPTSILRIFASIFRPTYSPTSEGRRMSTWLAGRNTGTPMSTSSPPLIFRETTPSTTSPSFLVARIRSHARMRSALRLERTTSPLSDSTASSRTSTLVPGLACSGLANSCRFTTPSLLSPTSTNTSLPATLTTLPVRIDPTWNCAAAFCMASSTSAGAPWPPSAAASSLRTCSSLMPKELMSSRSTMCSQHPPYVRGRARPQRLQPRPSPCRRQARRTVRSPVARPAGKSQYAPSTAAPPLPRESIDPRARTAPLRQAPLALPKRLSLGLFGLFHKRN